MASNHTKVVAGRDGSYLPGRNIIVDGDWRLCCLEPPWYVIYHNHGGELFVVFRKRPKGQWRCPKCDGSPPKSMRIAVSLLRM
jgi:hypothetical protein